MKLTFRLAALTTVIASAYAGGAFLAACSSGGGTKDGGADSSASDTGVKKDSGVKDTGGGTDAGGDAPGPTVDPQCTVPAGNPSGGSCIPGDAGLPCNPITNAGCDGGAGEACDFNNQTGVACYPPPPPNTTALCQLCDDQNTACLPGSSCQSATNGTMECMRFCCDDTDCTPGHCDKTTFQTDPIGFCVK